MGKQKFSCKGVLRSTGQRVSTMVSADNREAAIQIANQHGVTVESVMPVAEPAPTPPKIVENRTPEKRIPEKKLDASIDDILDADDEDLPGGLDDLDLGDDAGAAAVPGSPTTKACPYCGEQILAVAVKCKHCGSYVGAKAARPRPQPSDDDAPSPGAPMRVWAIVAGIVAVLIVVPVVIILVVIMSRRQPTPSVAPVPEPVAVSPPAAPTALPPAPTPPAYKPSPEEIAFAGKLAAFLGSCDDLVTLLEKGGKTEQYGKQSEAIKSRHAAIPPPPKGVAWAEAAMSSSDRILLALNFLAYGNATQDALAEALKQSPVDTPETRQAYKQVAGEIRTLATAVRTTIPAECLPKPK